MLRFVIRTALMGVPIKAVPRGLTVPGTVRSPRRASMMDRSWAAESDLLAGHLSIPATVIVKQVRLDAVHDRV